MKSEGVSQISVLIPVGFWEFAFWKFVIEGDVFDYFHSAMKTLLGFLFLTIFVTRQQRVLWNINWVGLGEKVDRIEARKIRS